MFRRRRLISAAPIHLSVLFFFFHTLPTRTPAAPSPPSPPPRIPLVYDVPRYAKH